MITFRGAGVRYIICFFSRRCLARNSLYFNKELYQSLAWTAHGVKVWDGHGSLDYVYFQGSSIPAMPEIDIIFSDIGLSSLNDRLSEIPIFQYNDSMTVLRDVRRIPLKIESNLEADVEHQSRSYDGLRQFYPFDIYESNISCTEGLLIGLERVQRVDGFGLESPSRSNQYSVLLVDIAIYWQLFRILYCFSGLVPIRHDMFMCLGFWHTYQHAHRLIWSEFRSTFLAPAWFVLFPDQTLLFAPKLLQSSTFFSYLRLSYSHWRNLLLESMDRMKILMAEEQSYFINNLSDYKKLKRTDYFK